MPFRLRSAVFPASICRPSGLLLFARLTAVCEADPRRPLTVFPGNRVATATTTNLETQKVLRKFPYTQLTCTDNRFTPEGGLASRLPNK